MSLIPGAALTNTLGFSLHAPRYKTLGCEERALPQTTGRSNMSAFSLNVARAGPSTNGPGSRSCRPCTRSRSGGREAYVRGAGRPAGAKLKCNLYPISLRAARVLRVHGVAQTGRRSPSICLIARNAGMAYRLLLLLLFTLQGWAPITETRATSARGMNNPAGCAGAWGPGSAPSHKDLSHPGMSQESPHP